MFTEIYCFCRLSYRACSAGRYSCVHRKQLFHTPRITAGCVRVRVLAITGDHIKQDLRYTQKPIYVAIFTSNIWSCLLWSPVIAAAATHTAATAPKATADSPSLRNVTCNHVTPSHGKPPLFRRIPRVPPNHTPHSQRRFIAHAPNRRSQKIVSNK